ncbi:MAG: ABC transporter ATP-binding protein [Firmicutes bacterium]|nr:ABC transporter ATP-binding protein [Bacillota bacterium]
MIALQGHKVTFNYPKSPLLFSEVDIQVGEGECVVLTGSSGCGKSTLCQILAGIIHRSIQGNLQGEVLLYGEKISNLTLAQVVSQVGIVFQDPDRQLFCSTVEDELAFGPENLCFTRGEITKRIEQVLEAVGITSLRTAEIRTLSQGQKQLVALAATLTLKPRVLILDEVFSPLDRNSIRQVKEVLVGLRTSGYAILIVDHNPAGLELADRIYKLGNGRIREVRYDRHCTL